MSARTGEGTRFRVRPTVTITLSCGCRVKARDVPMPTARMGCTSGLAHGYKLRWVQAVLENGKVFQNRKFS